MVCWEKRWELLRVICCESLPCSGVSDEGGNSGEQLWWEMKGSQLLHYTLTTADSDLQYSKGRRLRHETQQEIMSHSNLWPSQRYTLVLSKEACNYYWLFSSPSWESSFFSISSQGDHPETLTEDHFIACLMLNEFPCILLCPVITMGYNSSNNDRLPKIKHMRWN